MHGLTKVFLVAAASGATVYAQTSSTCNPTLKSGCPVDPALSKAVEYDFTKGAPDDFTASTGSAPTFDGDGGKFTIAKSGDAPTLTSKWYMMFGHYEVVLQTAPGVGTVSSIVLQSDDLDEVDWEWLGADAANVQTNYYGKGNTAVYDRGETIPDAGNQDGFHTYALDWTADAITWSIDGKTIRTLTPETADKDQYPQTPMQLKLGTWAGGDPSEPKGTIQWAGGEIDYTKGPFTMTVKSVKAVDYSTGKSYSYGDMTGNWQSIKSDGGQINSQGNANAPVSQAAASGTAVPDSTSVAKLDNPVASGSAPPTVAAGSVATGSAMPANATAAGSSMATVVTGSTGVAPFPTGNATAPHASGSGSGSSPAATTGSGSGSGSAAASGSASPNHSNAAGHLGASIVGTGLMAVLAAALLA